MTSEEAIKHLEYSKRAYQNLIDNDNRKMEAIGKDLKVEFRSATIMEDCYRSSMESLEMGIQALKCKSDLLTIKDKIINLAWELTDQDIPISCIFLRDILNIFDAYIDVKQ